jgi:hypothetical protein
MEAAGGHGGAGHGGHGGAGHGGPGAGLAKGLPPNADMTNMLRHIEQLEGKLSAKEMALLDAQQRVEKFSARTREGMQSALDSLMKKWMDACYATPGARTPEDVLGKRKAEGEPDGHVEEDAASLWTDFAKECGAF